MARINVVEAVLKECRADPVLKLNRRVVVAVSGGPDSTALLHALARGARRLGLELTAAHLDHGWRTDSGDAARVRELCGELRVPLETGTAPAAVRRRATEEAARDARHAFLEGLAESAGAGTIALGHTSDDQAETVLMHIIRGAGLEGLSAMAVREGRRFRPLLHTPRAVIEAHCARHGLAPVHDPSNTDLRYTRNRVRAELLPLMETFNPGIREALARLAAAARMEHDAVTGRAEAWLGRRRPPYLRSALATEPAAVRVEVVRRAWAAADGGRGPAGDAARLRQAMRLIADGRRRGIISLGRGLHLHTDGDHFHIA